MRARRDVGLTAAEIVDQLEADEVLEPDLRSEVRKAILAGGGEDR